MLLDFRYKEFDYELIIIFGSWHILTIAPHEACFYLYLDSFSTALLYKIHPFKVYLQWFLVYS